MGCPSSVCRNLSAGGQLEHPSDVKSSTSTGVRTSAPASAPSRRCGPNANIQAPIESTTITETAGIFIVFSPSSCPPEWMSRRRESYVLRPLTGSNACNFCLSAASNKTGSRNLFAAAAKGFVMSSLVSRLSAMILGADVCRCNRVQRGGQGKWHSSGPSDRCADGVVQRPADCGSRWWLLLGHSGRIPTHEGRDQRGLGLLRRLGEDRRIRTGQHRRNRSWDSVQIIYDPSKITYGQLLRVFFSVAHDPTQLNRQGPDVGTQYRTSIFYGTDEQKRIAEAYIAQLDKAKVFQRPIVT